MAWNMPTYDTDNYTFGPCVVYIGSCGVTPSTDLGAVRGNTEVVVSKEVLEIKQGSPQVVTKQYITAQGARISFTSLEALGKLQNLLWGLGQGVQTGTPGTGTETLGYGGSVNLDEVAVMLVHELPTGTTLKLCFWRCQGKADLTMAFNETGETGIPMEFEALDGTTDFYGQAIATSSTERIFRIIKINAP